jgi:UDP-N-acetylmuramoyl-L-alanyl-D-glutamate--2,6-diaminopimelate ligase
VRSIRFDAAVFTNLTRDHLDYHVTQEAYREAKKRLFDGLEEGAAAIYNADDPAGLYMIRDTRARTISYGIDEPATIRGEIIEDRTDGLRMSVDGEERHFHLVGRFNAYNLLAAYTAARSLGHPGKEVLDALAASPSVPGRFEIVRFDDGSTAIIDYAHTPDALENVLRTILATKEASATLWCLFGCGGDRDREKRPMMGAIAERLADEVIVTSDNPRTEDPSSILRDIREGMEEPERALWIVDRRQAIREAAHRVRAGDIVLVAGKGHETYQIIGREKQPFDDKQILKEEFADRHDDNPPRRK